MKKNIIYLLISIVLAELVGLLSSLFAGNSGELYKTLTLPPFSPPGWIFPVVWTILYACMGIAAYLIFASSSSSKVRRKALALYGAQLFVNFLWSIAFFRFEWFCAAVAVIIILDILVIWTITHFSKISRLAAVIMIPYLIWILFATYLNIGICLLN